MGLCLCTFSTPCCAVVGAPLSCIAPKISHFVEEDGHFTLKDKKKHAAFYALLLLVGLFGMYLPLTFLCARLDDRDWTLFYGQGECWSTGGSMPYQWLGLLAGICIGIGFTAFLLTLSKRTSEDDVVVAEKEVALV
eukprot:CAMPEP_0195520818 /NCGR_PEP_ID=MMETSP0794_2-20130614/17564_1 /TAXON_ID=515487 /ORGANISM="Stephanopyxis turris, Strain CCMP 815" /LENGTH=135 /DNA_ID=CAMNT_0040650245 /DNA_START=24 /DNA_END=431 /DNA_ORIENTATION=-